jgi:hypothetical protein
MIIQSGQSVKLLPQVQKLLPLFLRNDKAFFRIPWCGLNHDLSIFHEVTKSFPIQICMGLSKIGYFIDFIAYFLNSP